jgi:predicted 2-oxoglutarate/Fe(II)-dependent dioxygenase YbiX
MPPALAAGDLVPRIALPGPDGKIVDLGHQTIAGNAVVLWLAGPAPDAAAFARLAALLPRLKAAEALAYAVVAVPPAAAEAPAPVLFDPERKLLAPFGLNGPGIVVYDSDRRLAAVLPDSDFAAAAALCERLFAATGPLTVSRQAPVLMLPGVFEPALIAELLGYWDKGDKKSDAVATAAGRDYGAPDVKKRIDVVVTDAALSAKLQERLTRRVAPEIAKAYQHAVGYLEPFRIGCYDSASGGHFLRHRDNSTRYTAHRLFAVTLNLNTGEYTGGGVRFPEYGRMVYAPEAGAAVVFSCALLHEVLPVTQGRRFGVFTFMHDEAGERQVQKLIAEERAAGRTGERMSIS